MNKICPKCKSDLHVYGHPVENNKMIVCCLNCNYKSEPQERDTIQTLKDVKDQWR